MCSSGWVFCKDPSLGVAGQAEHHLGMSLKLYQHSCILDPIAMKIMPNILSVAGRKHKQAHGLPGFGVLGAIPSLEDLLYLCFGGTDAKGCFFPALKERSRSGALNDDAGPADLGPPRLIRLSAIFLQCT